jgi:nucleoprotein TPR
LGDTSEEDVEGELRSQIASLVEELKSSRDEADKLRERCSTFEKLAKDNENAVAEQTKALNTAKEAHSSEIALLQSHLDVATTQSSKSKEIIAELTDDLAAQRDERSKELEKMDKLINELRAQSEEYRRDAESAQNRYAQLETEVIVLRTDVVSAQTNYERELSLHATARTDLRAAKEVQEAELRLRTIAEEQAAAAKADLIDQLASFEAKKAEMESREKEYEKNLDDTRAQNALLHGQLETINKQIERIQSGKGGMAEDAEGMTEADSLHKTISELREVVRFVRADKEMIQNQLDSARRAAERERASAAIAKRSLEEARAELKVLQESTG